MDLQLTFLKYINKTKHKIEKSTLDKLQQGGMDSLNSKESV